MKEKGRKQEQHRNDTHYKQHSIAGVNSVQRAAQQRLCTAHRLAREGE